MAYVPFSTTAKGPLAPGVDVEDFPDVVPADDAGLAVPPGDLANSLADVVSHGTRSPSARLFAFGRLIKSPYQSLIANRKAFQGNGWTGTSRARSAATPVYAVRTKSGGALVWFGLDLEHSYRSKSPNSGMTWQSQNYGDLQKGFGVPSTVRSRLTKVDRNEFLAYIPPKGKIQVIANRWFPVSIQGR
ncbi:hypothetical protein ACIBHX_20305 [Nonomuraea sp. NPDC050536]|uniref:hypothetical protein n=1 Tax=Nonomuraea sp. NPDC050536 TaxID=3364366 RepID=UPI0037C95C5B